MLTRWIVWIFQCFKCQICQLVVQLRFLLPELTIYPQTACFSMLWLLDQDATTLKPHVKYCSRASVFNHVYVKKEPLEISSKESSLIYEKLKTTADMYTVQCGKL